MDTIFNVLRQSYFIAKPALTEKNLPDLKGKVSCDPVLAAKRSQAQALAQVFIVTGGNSGCGFELVKLLYQKNGTVYVAGRSAERCTTAIGKIMAEFHESGGRLEFLKVDLGDLTTIKKAADEFLGKEHRLDVLWNNAGVMEPPKGSVTAQVRFPLRMATGGGFMGGGLSRCHDCRATSFRLAPTASVTFSSPSYFIRS